MKSKAKLVLDLFYEDSSVKIPVENSGILEIPDGKNFWDMSLDHYKKLVDKNGYDAISKALENLVIWNKNNNPDISKKASDLQVALKKEEGK